MSKQPLTGAEAQPAPAGLGAAADAPGWDLGTRLFHWGLVVAVTAGWGLGKFGPLEMTWHFWAGYCVSALLLFRLVWGLSGPQITRFSSFLHRPGKVLAYMRTLPQRRAAHQGGGHNPLGGWMVVVMLLVLVAQVATGLTLDPEDYINAGPLAEWVSEDIRRFSLLWHGRLGWILLTLIGLHVAAILFYAIWKRTDLVRPMVTGRGSGRGQSQGQPRP